MAMILLSAGASCMERCLARCQAERVLQEGPLELPIGDYRQQPTTSPITVPPPTTTEDDGVGDLPFDLAFESEAEE